MKAPHRSTNGDWDDEYIKSNALWQKACEDLTEQNRELTSLNAKLAEALSRVSARLECVREAAIKEPKGALHSWFIAHDHGLYEGVIAALALVREGKEERK